MRRGECLVMRRPVTGFTFVGVLVTIALLSIGMAAVGPMWADQVRREREAELLRIGSLYAEAISRYRDASPGALKRHPTSLDALLLDQRYVGTQRYLRRLYTDPLRPGEPWAIIKDEEGGIRGVFSPSIDPPLRRGTVDLGSLTLAAAQRYADWHFVSKEGP